MKLFYLFSKLKEMGIIFILVFVFSLLFSLGGSEERPDCEGGQGEVSQ